MTAIWISSCWGSDSEGGDRSGSGPARPSQLGTQGLGASRPRVNGFTNRVRVSWQANRTGASPQPADILPGHVQHDDAVAADAQSSGSTVHGDDVPSDT
eukprot:7338365-Pyramimonas_sp.AAC.1